MARPGLAIYHGWIRLKSPYEVIMEDDGSITLKLSDGFRTFTWNESLIGISFTAQRSGKRICIPTTSREIYCCYVHVNEAHRTIQYLITSLAELRMVYSRFLD